MSTHFKVIPRGTWTAIQYTGDNLDEVAAFAPAYVKDDGDVCIYSGDPDSPNTVMPVCFEIGQGAWIVRHERDAKVTYEPFQNNQFYARWDIVDQ